MSAFSKNKRTANNAIRKINRSEQVYKDRKNVATKTYVKKQIIRNAIKGRIDVNSVIAQNVTTTAGIIKLYDPVTDTMLDDMQLYCKIVNPTLNVAVRILIFQWKDTTVPVVADLLSLTTTPISPIGYNPGDELRTCGGKLHMLTDKLFTLDIVNMPIKAWVYKYYKSRLLDIKSDGTEFLNVPYILYMSDTAFTPPILTVNSSIRYREL